MTFQIERLPRQPESLYRDVRCDGCNVPLKPVESSCVREDGAWEYLQPDDALEVHLVGGYGMAIDPCNEPEPVLLFCAKCLQKLCEQWPCFAKVIEAGCSSSMAHHCSKERRFVWRSSSCCSVYCAKCGEFGSLCEGREDPDDMYSRPIVNCIGPSHGFADGCDHVGPGVWAWERTVESKTAEDRAWEAELNDPYERFG